MTDLDSGLARGFLAECCEQLILLETELLALENGGPAVDADRADRAFRLVHSIRGGAYFLDLAKIGDLAHRTEDILGLVRDGKIIPTPERFNVLLSATDRLHELIQDADASNDADIRDVMEALTELHAEPASPKLKAIVSTAATAGRSPKKQLRMLLVEDDFTSRLVLQTFLSRYGDCHVAVNGKEAVEACRVASELGQTYDLICMDIMMPEMDGREAVHRIRALEEAHGVLSTRGAKITMTTTVGDVRKVFQCFKELCDAYLIKPIDLSKLLGFMKSWGMVA